MSEIYIVKRLKGLAAACFAGPDGLIYFELTGFTIGPYSVVVLFKIPVVTNQAGRYIIIGRLFRTI